MKPQIFGTDGIRGRAGEGWLTDAAVEKLGEAVGELLQERREGFGERDASAVSLVPTLVMARDTRPSGAALAAALARGLTRRGCDVVDLGVAPTPTLAEGMAGASAGAVLSASHNPPQDNGIKLFSARASKLPQSTEVEIEALLMGTRPAGAPWSGRPGVLATRPREEVLDRYSRHLSAHLTAVQGGVPDLQSQSLVVDCAEGAASPFAPPILQALGASVEAIHAGGVGARINDHCGALHPGTLAAAVRSTSGSCGLAFDGDADRLVMVDEDGEARDGDHVLWVLACDLHARGQLAQGTVVGTVMTNLGLEVALKERGIRLHRTPVGDRHVTAAMQQLGSDLGGEQSGHLIVRGPGPVTGDGLLAGLHVLSVMQRSKRSLSQLCSDLELYPQRTINVPVTHKPPLEQTDLIAAGAAVEADLGTEGRVLLRYSGTENKLRVMVEGRHAGQVDRHAQHLAAAAEKLLG